MGFLLKPRVTEREAAGMFLKLLSENVERSWPRIFEIIRPTFPAKVAVVDSEQSAKIEFFLAVLATHLQDLEQVFEAARAARLRRHILNLLREPDFSEARDPGVREHRKATLAEYRRIAEPAATSTGRSLEAIAGLLHERLGATFSPSGGPLEAGSEGRDALSSLLSNFDVRWWRYFIHKYRIKTAKPPRAGRRAAARPNR